jgi:hypothetical protein
MAYSAAELWEVHTVTDLQGDIPGAELRAVKKIKQKFLVESW